MNEISCGTIGFVPERDGVPVFFKKNISYDNVEYHAETAKMAGIYNAVACCVWLMAFFVWVSM